MVELSLLDRKLIVSVFLWEDLLVRERLDGGMMVMLMSLAINCLSDVLVASWLHGFAGDRSADALVDLRGMATFAGEIGDGFLCRLHDNVLFGMGLGLMIWI